MNYSWELVKIFIYLGIIIGIIVLTAKVFKKGYFQHNQGKYLKVIEQIYLGQKNILSLVKVKDKIILFSVAPDRIEKIKEWPEEEFDNLFPEESVDFKSQLKKYIKGSWRDNNV